MTLAPTTQLSPFNIQLSTHPYIRKFPVIASMFVVFVMVAVFQLTYPMVCQIVLLRFAHRTAC